MSPERVFCMGFFHFQHSAALLLWRQTGTFGSTYISGGVSTADSHKLDLKTSFSTLCSVFRSYREQHLRSRIGAFCAKDAQ